MPTPPPPRRTPPAPRRTPPTPSRAAAARPLPRPVPPRPTPGPDEAQAVDLASYPPGSRLHGQTVLTGWRHLVRYETLPAPGKATALHTVCGKVGRPYVYGGSGLRATTQRQYVDCPDCLVAAE